MLRGKLQWSGGVSHHAAASIVGNLSTVVVLPPVAGSFDCVRLPPHSAQDDNLCMVVRPHGQDVKISSTDD